MTTKNDIKKQMLDSLHRGDLDLKDFPMTELDWLLKITKEEIDRQREEDRVWLIGVGGTHLFDKHFLDSDIESARAYALKRAQGQLEKGRDIEVVMNRHRVYKSELKQYLSMKGEFE